MAWLARCNAGARSPWHSGYQYGPCPYCLHSAHIRVVVDIVLRL
jgi:hypothetical protein